LPAPPRTSHPITGFYVRLTPAGSFFTPFLRGAAYSSIRIFGDGRAALELTDITFARRLEYGFGNWMNSQGVNMDDLLYLGLMVACFALSVALVYGFEKLRRPQ
jgi:hypothetical protein